MIGSDIERSLKPTFRWMAAAVVIVAAVVIASSPAWMPAAIDCTTATIENARALAQSDRDLQVTANGDRVQRCKVYQRRVEALAATLTAVNTHPGICFLSHGRGDLDLGAGLNVSAELSVFKRLADETCT